MVEYIFKLFPNVKAEPNKFHVYIDLYIKSIPYDIKVSNLPRHCSRDLEVLKREINALIRWMYKEQSKGRREHYENRLFVVVFDWKMKSDAALISEQINLFLQKFTPENANQLTIEISETYYLNNQEKLLSNSIQPIIKEIVNGKTTYSKSVFSDIIFIN